MRPFRITPAIIVTLVVAGLVVCGELLAADKVPVIDVTDLYYPGHDVTDNFDIIAAYALPEIDLKAVIIDVTERFRAPAAEIPEYKARDKGGPRDPGVIQVTQLNYIFDRNVPYGVGPFNPMTSPEDKMLDAPVFQQSGVQLMIDVLKASPVKMDILSFGSVRPVAVAFNREPQLFRDKVRRLHLCAGATTPEYLEWNVLLDPKGFVRLLRSDLPIAIYPCATPKGPFDYSPNNCFWRLPSLAFIPRMEPKLRNYLTFTLNRSTRSDILRAMDEEPDSEQLKAAAGRWLNIWETSVWSQTANRKVVRRADGKCRIIPAAEVKPDDKVLPNEVKPCKIKMDDTGKFSFEYTSEPTNLLMYDRGDPRENEKALQEALPELYASFKIR